MISLRLQFSRPPVRRALAPTLVWAEGDALVDRGLTNVTSVSAGGSCSSDVVARYFWRSCRILTTSSRDQITEQDGGASVSSTGRMGRQHWRPSAYAVSVFLRARPRWCGAGAARTSWPALRRRTPTTRRRLGWLPAPSAGVANDACRAQRTSGRGRPGLKWPNDVRQYDGRKLASNSPSHTRPVRSWGRAQSCR